MSLKTIDYVLWLLPALMQAAICVLMVRQDLRQKFPFFFTYSLFQVLSATALFLVFRFADYSQYFFAFWTSTALGVLLGFVVIYEVFSYAIRPYPGLRGLGAMLFRWAVLLLVLITGISAASSTGSGAGRVVQEIVNLERSVRLIQCGLLLFVVMCSGYLGLSARNLATGIAFGFGMIASSDLVLYNLRAAHGAEWNRSLSMVSSIMYNLAVMTWFGYMLMPEAARKRSEIVYRPAFDRWNQAALLIMNDTPQAESHTYLSDIEQTVETVMAQNNRAH